MGKFYISNEIRFLAGLNEGIMLPACATHMKKAEAENFIKKYPRYATYKIRTSKKKTDYVISTPMRFLGRDNNAVTDIKQALAFDTVEEAYKYMDDNNLSLHGLCYVINDSFRRFPRCMNKVVLEDVEPENKLVFDNMETSDRIFIPASVKKAVFMRSNGICEICGRPMSRHNFTIDHIKPLSRQGTNEPDNLRAVHEKCNKMKDNYLDNELLSYVADVASNLFFSRPTDESSKKIIRAIVRGTIAKSARAI